MPDVEVFVNICQHLENISGFLQILCYGLFLVFLIYFGYWFFSRFFR